ncbi:Hint domain-containing protein [Rhodovulum bhavnagarense]|uniref:Hint domain-containing protein n=1 Tax=Rhodovulum bhavnagarense TaxID=992286 RepID=A0A4R2RJU7_9RHOB|nr:Hint domain-containing protein [Rhodovulum bhavnagarense]TCP63154.1 Hint domain-containing protein [Rhodovulum bhavnagarense]
MTVASPDECPDTASYGCHVFPATDLAVVSGANLGDGLGCLDDLCPGDIYTLRPGAEALHLAIRDTGGRCGEFLGAGPIAPSVAAGTEYGRPGATLTLEGRLTFMGADGAQVAILLISVEGERDRPVFLPLDPIEPKVSYALIRVETEPGPVRLADITAVAFTRGTMIALAGGAPRAVEDLRPGDRVLTRDHGPQPLRWVGQRTVRAVGSCAPVVISKGTLGNDADLIVSQHQRVFLYRRGAERLARTPEVLLKALHLVEDDRVFIRRGGFVDYFNLVFDNHEIIYAEGVPTESLLVNEAMLGRLPDDLAKEVSHRFPQMTQRPHYGSEADVALLRLRGPEALHRAPRRA